MKRPLLCAALCLALAAPYAMPRAALAAEVTILHTTDAHGYVAPDDTRIGLDTVAAFKRQTPDAILLDAGDFLHGSPLAGERKGLGIIALMKQAGYWAATVGNHEFSHGRQALEEALVNAAATPNPLHILSANTRLADGTHLTTPWASTTVNGVKLCVFGLTTPETKVQTMPETVRDLTFADPLITARETVAELRAAGCGLVIALTHIGSDAQVAFTSPALAESVPGLDAVIDGHSHREFTATSATGRPVASAGAHGKAVGKLVFSVNPETGERKAVENILLHKRDLAAIRPDTDITEGITALQQAADARRAEILVASVATPLSGDRQTMRTQETALGDMVADALRAAYKTDAAIINAGAIRAGIPQGPFTRRELEALFPFGGTVVSLRVTGAELREILEHSLSKLPGADGAFPQISGIIVRYDASRDTGKRVVSLKDRRGRTIRPKKLYTIATNDFLAQGGDGYPILATKSRLQAWKSMPDAFLDFLHQRGIPYANPQGRLVLRKK